MATYARNVAVFLRRARRKGLKHKPSNVVKVMLLDHEQRERQIDTLQGIEDVLRVLVSCFPLVLYGADSVC